MADAEEAKAYTLEVLKDIPTMNLSIILAVAHNQFNHIKTSYWKRIPHKNIIFDLKGLRRDLNPMILNNLIFIY